LPLNTQDFVRDFVHGDPSRYVDLGNYDCGATESKIYVRDKRTNTVEEMQKSGVRVQRKTRVSPSYYLAVFGLLALAFYFSVFFLRDALGEDIWLLGLLAIYVLPFIVRRFTSGFKVLGIYFAACIVFSLTVGSWQENEFGSGVLIFFLVGIAPYIVSKVFRRIWTEVSVELSSDRNAVLSIPQEKVRPLVRLLGTSDGFTA